jgi:hypothetical protein
MEKNMEKIDIELSNYGFELCEMSGECDFCEKETEQRDYFWKRTSYETIEGDYSCRNCASKQAREFDEFIVFMSEYIEIHKSIFM